MLVSLLSSGILGSRPILSRRDLKPLVKKDEIGQILFLSHDQIKDHLHGGFTAPFVCSPWPD